MRRLIGVPAAVILTLLALPSFAQQRDLIPNRVKYSDTGLKPASGRAADIAVEARALLGRDGLTDLELTTGSFEGGVAPTGTLTRVQVKAGLELEEPLTRSYDASGSSASVRLDGLALGPREQIQVQTSAQSTDLQRTGVVTVTETVKRRPDLRIGQVSVPPNVIAGHPANIYLGIIESNGDVGARANCVLRVDGVEVDGATNIWVDARGSVSCAMTHIFTTPGTHQVQLAIEGVSPGDWDPTNNVSWPVSVRVRDASEVVAGGTYRATATERLYDSEYMLQADESAPEWENEYSRNTKTTNITRLDAAMPAELDFATMKVSLTEASDGLTLLDVQSYDWLQVGDWPSANCAELRWGRPFSFFGCVNNGVTTFHFARVSEVTRYYSRWWGVYIRYSNGDAYSYGYDHDMNMTSIFGGNRMYGETVSMQLIASDADQIWQIDPFMSFQSWSDPDQNTQGCIETWRGPACWTRTVRNGGRNGGAEQ